ncbi:MAG: hypothetical protein WCJ81_03675 [bacterium]
MFVLLYKEAFDLVARGITNPNYGENNLNSYIPTITKENPASGLIGSYYFS